MEWLGTTTVQFGENTVTVISINLYAGMVGNYNGNVTDDVVFRNGTMVPISEFSFRILHQVGLSCELLTL